MSSFLYIKMFNGNHILVLLTIPVFLFVSYFLLRNRTGRTKDIFFWVIFACMIALVASNMALNLVRSKEWRDTVLYKLPLHLCGINVLLYPLFFCFRNSERAGVRSTLFAYMFFVGSPAALLGSLMPPPDCLGPLFTSDVFTYLFKHNMMFLLPILMVMLGYYRPVWKDMLRAVGILAALVVTMHCVNLALSKAGGYMVNYFYTRHPEGNPVLLLFWRMIPVELVYSFSLILILIPVFAIYYAPFLARDIKAYRIRQKSVVVEPVEKPL